MMMQISEKLTKIIQNVSEEELMYRAYLFILPDTSAAEALRMGFSMRGTMLEDDIILYAFSSAEIQYYFVCKSEEEICEKAKTWK